MEALGKELVDRIQKKLDARFCRLEVQLQEQTDQITQQLEAKLCRLEKQLQDLHNQDKWDLQADRKIIEDLPLPRASRTITQATQTSEEAPHSTTADTEVENVGVHLLPEEEEKRWEICQVSWTIHRAVCKRDAAVVAGEDGTLEFYSSGKVVRRYLELGGKIVVNMFCSDEYIGVWLSNHSVACYRWFSDRLEWLYCLYRDGQTWGKAGRTSGVPFRLPSSIYSQGRDMVCYLYGGQVSGWSLSKDRTIFIIKVRGAKDLRMTPDLVLVAVHGGKIEVFNQEGKNLYIVPSKGIDFSIFPPLTNTDYTALVASNKSTITWPTSSRERVTRTTAFDSALHPDLPHLCSSVRGKPWHLALRDLSTHSVIWRQPQRGTEIEVFSIDSEFLLIKPAHAPVRILRWASGEVAATLPLTGCVWSTSPQYIICSEQIFYRDQPVEPLS